MKNTCYILFLTSFSILMSTVLWAKGNKIKSIPRDFEELNANHSYNNVWVFIMAGQSNMAGRAKIENSDTISNPRILSINHRGKILVAKEPLHFYEPNMFGLDCGISFGKELLKHIPDSITILILPTAVGGSSIRQWTRDSIHRNVKLLTKF